MEMFEQEHALIKLKSQWMDPRAEWRGQREEWGAKIEKITHHEQQGEMDGEKKLN